MNCEQILLTSFINLIGENLSMKFGDNQIVSIRQRMEVSPWLLVIRVDQRRWELCIVSFHDPDDTLDHFCTC